MSTTLDMSNYLGTVERSVSSLERNGTLARRVPWVSLDALSTEIARGKKR